MTYTQRRSSENFTKLFINLLKYMGVAVEHTVNEHC